MNLGRNYQFAQAFSEEKPTIRRAAYFEDTAVIRTKIQKLSLFEHLIFLGLCLKGSASKERSEYVNNIIGDSKDISVTKYIRLKIQENSISETFISVPWRCSTNPSDEQRLPMNK